MEGNNKLIQALNNAIKNAPQGASAPQWYYSATTTGVIKLNQAMARVLVKDGAQLTKYKNGGYKTQYSYDSAPELYKALEQVLTSAYKNYKIVKNA